jgi:hypothetical protein
MLPQSTAYHIWVRLVDTTPVALNVVNSQILMSAIAVAVATLFLMCVIAMYPEVVAMESSEKTVQPDQLVKQVTVI